jgi:hypothetical protein
MFLFEQIVVESAMIIATLVATTCLLIILAGFVLQRRAQRTAALSPDRDVHAARGAGRSARVASTCTPSHN